VQLKLLRVPTFEADYGDEASIKQLSEDYLNHPQGGSLDVLINSAGKLRPQPVGDRTTRKPSSDNTPLPGIYFPFDDRPFQDFSADEVLEHFKINTLVSPLLAPTPISQRSSPRAPSSPPNTSTLA
jgi:NAD(P)-dependent dehydrogenase (short-subunit alcohol dehydrogenase family)